MASGFLALSLVSLRASVSLFSPEWLQLFCGEVPVVILLAGTTSDGDRISEVSTAAIRVSKAPPGDSILSCTRGVTSDGIFSLLEPVIALRMLEKNAIVELFF